MNINEKLRELRSNAGLSQAKAAAALSVGTKAYQAYESGRASPPIEVLQKLSKFYNISIDELLGGTGIKGKIKSIEKAYYAMSLEKRKIVDFIMGLNN